MRPSFEAIYMELANILAERATCRRKQVGCVLTTPDYTRVLGIGYNGNVSGFVNDCEREGAGVCGCIHAETNALIKANGKEPKIAFLTLSPCEACAKLMAQSNVIEVYYGEKYRKQDGLEVLDRANIPHQKEWRYYLTLEG